MLDNSSFALQALLFLSSLFIFVIGLVVLWAIIAYIRDISQTEQAIRRNYPVIGRFRSLFERLGEFFRQYFFAMDREELPFNRALRSWVYRAAKNPRNTIAFGSTRDLTPSGTILFVNTPFPTLGEDAVPPSPVTIGNDDCMTPYTTSSLFNISGMSYGAISKPAVRALSMGARKAGCWMNTGEGGLAPFHLEGGCDLVFQIGTAKNGVRNLAGELDDDKLREIAAHPQVRMFEIKMSQGAKPGKGGMLPAEKVTEEIATIRNIPVGEAAVSPNRHTDIRNNRDLLEMINHIRTVSGKPVGFKAVFGGGGWLDSLCEEINELGTSYAPDFITIDGAEGGTGAAPMPLMDYMGLPLAESLPMVVDSLNRHGLRDRIKVIASGKLITPGPVAWALCVGADFVVSARGFMFALGCIQALQCNKNSCPTGITTHNTKLQRGLHPETKADHIASYVTSLVTEIGMIAHSCGVKSPRELRREHARVVQDSSLSIPLNELHPPIENQRRDDS